MDRHSPRRSQGLLGEQDNPAVSLLVAEEPGEAYEAYEEGEAGLHGEDAHNGLHAEGYHGEGYEDGHHGGIGEEDGYPGEGYAAGEYAPGEYAAAEVPAEEAGRPAGVVQFAEQLAEGLLGTRPKQPGRPQRTRKKGEGKKPFLKRSWLCITPTGETSVLQADKYKLTAQLGIQTRDLRLLDPAMATTYPSAILCRDKCIIVNLEHIKVIITTDKALVVNHEDEGNARFVEELKQRIAHPSNAMSKSFPSTHDLQRLAATAGTASAPNLHGAAAGKGGLGSGGGAAPPGKGLPLSGITAQLPFELRVLEICLDELASEYDLQATELEAAAYPALDTLAAKVTSPHLERVRRLKNRLVRLTTRVETVREVLEKFLDDDEDMHDLNLTAKKEREAESDVEDLDHHAMGPGAGASPYHPPGAGAMPDGGAHAAAGPPRVLGADGKLSYLGRRVSVRSRSSASSASTDSSIMESEVAEVEMLLEAYFMHFDNTFNRLTTLSEYIKDTEDLVNIKLDQHRNQLITTDLILTAFTASMAIITTVAGIFGMNLDSGLQEAEGVFNQVTIATCVGSVMLFFAFVVWAWRYGLLVFD